MATKKKAKKQKWGSHNKKMLYSISGAALVILLAVIAAAIIFSKKNNETYAEINTTEGMIVVQLFPDKAPITVANFESYANSGFYNGTIFHRIIPGFVIQGGGFEANGNQKQTKAPIKNEATNNLSNTVGTIAMARTTEINSATSQFFINLANNTFLNHKGNTDQTYGYAVFGKVISGMDVVNKIAESKTETKGYMQNWPANPVIIKSVKITHKFREE